MKYYIGVMSGTSCDGIDVALVDLNHGVQTVATAFERFPAELQEQLLNLIAGKPVTPPQISQLDAHLGMLYAAAVLRLLEQSQVKPEHVQAIGLHGQTVYHGPDDEYPNTWQLGSAAIVAQRTGITTVSNFRQLDVAFGGQGAPLAPVFHQQVFAKESAVIGVLNLGGIANVSVLSATEVVGFDTGPANCLMDEWITVNKQLPFDAYGAWAQEGEVDDELLNRMMQEPYFNKSFPKSTGRELFNQPWLKQCMGESEISAEDVQRTLLQLTVESIAVGIEKTHKVLEYLVVCGGGVHNRLLLQLLSQRLNLEVFKSDVFGVDADFVEATLMAWLAQQNLEQNRLDLSAVTGAKEPLIYGVQTSI